MCKGQLEFDLKNAIYAKKHTFKIDEADAALGAAINALSAKLDSVKSELQEKDRALQTFIIIVCVISCVAFCGCGTLAAFYIRDKKKI